MVVMSWEGTDKTGHGFRVADVQGFMNLLSKCVLLLGNCAAPPESDCPDSCFARKSDPQQLYSCSNAKIISVSRITF